MHFTAMTVKETLSINYQNLGKKPNWQKQPVGHLQSKIYLKYEQWEIDPTSSQGGILHTKP